ncbi:MAG: hypothetical protein ACLUN5_07520 [Oscillospiraceae bacterium]
MLRTNGTPVGCGCTGKTDAATQRRRFLLLESGLTIHDIAKAENCGYNAVFESIQWAKKKLKNFEKVTGQNAIFCRIK